MKVQKKSRASQGTKTASAKKSSPKKAAAKTTAKAARKAPRAAKAVAATKTDRTAKAGKRKKPDSKTQVRELMSSEIMVCVPTENLASAASKMWNADCGCLPVVDGDGSLSGWITDRDICMAVGMQPTPAAEIQVSQVMSGPVRTCRDSDDIHVALNQMADLKIRRLAVVDADDALCGVLSIADVIRVAQTRATTQAPSKVQVLDALQSLSSPREIAVPA